MTQPFLAMIIPVGEGVPTHPIAPGGPGQPPGYWGGVAPPLPTHPIAPGGSPPGYWGGVAPPLPTHPIAPGGPPPGYWGGVAPPLPTHPIAPGGRPPGIWGGAPSYPDQGLPGPQPTPTPPIYLPPGSLPGTKPEHPIYIPPGIWPNPGVPTHPIVLPPPGSSEKPEVLENWNAVTAWTPQSGWIVAIVPSEEHPGVPTPS
jgi:hypothetical protein